MESETNLAPWEIEEETEEEREARYKREAEEMKLKWDARRLEETQSAERRRAFASREMERAQLYGPRDPIMEAYEARVYEEARVIEVCRRQREVYERIKAAKEGRPLPPKGTPYVNLRPPAPTPPRPEEFDVSGRYRPEPDLEDRKYRAPPDFVSPSGQRPPPRHMRGAPKAAWEDPPYFPPPPNARPPPDYPEPGDPVEGVDFPPPLELPDATAAPPAPAARTAAPKAKAKAKAKAAPAPPPAPAPAPAPAPEPVAEAPAAASIPCTVEQAKKMKVAELREALVSAGLDSKGLKKDLLQRLVAAIEAQQ